MLEGSTLMMPLGLLEESSLGMMPLWMLDRSPLGMMPLWMLDIEEEIYVVTDTFLSYGLHMTRSKSDEHFV